MICACVGAETAEQALAEMAEARRQGADLCELRADYLRDPDLPGILSAKPLPVLVTVRPKWEGGRFEGSEAERLGLLEDACLHGADYVDVEFRAYKGFQRRQAGLVLSYHDFEKTPDDVERTAAKMAELDPLVVKIACRALGAADLVRLARLQRQAARPTAVVAMGEYGEPLRILYRKYGGFLTYASVRGGAETAPGQVTVEELVRLYQGKTIDEETSAYGVIGDPVAHSRGPLLFNDVFKQLGMNARYVRIRVDDAATVRDLVSVLGFRGLSVTIPHKQAVMAALDGADEIAKGIGAANTVVARDGRLEGHNTDVMAAVEALKDAAVRKWSHGVYGMRALVLGAGGVSRAIAWGLKREAARVTIANRTFERGKALAEELGVDCARWHELPAARPQIVVNGTSVGMAPRADESPVDATLFTKDMVAMDTVYTPRETRFLKDAAARGALAVDGVEMFLRQANHQFRLWTGRSIPTEIYKEWERRL